jgi:hypothetical protein
VFVLVGILVGIVVHFCFRNGSGVLFQTFFFSFAVLLCWTSSVNRDVNGFRK